ncbi:MAG: PD-(D/E)XK nuclease family protein, partial [Anaerolineales bacterium]
MPANLVLIPDLAVAFQHINNQIDNCKSNKTLSTTYMLMPTTAAISSARWQLESSLGVRMVQFYGLGEIILEAASAPIQRLSDISIRRLVGGILRELFSAGSLTTFASVWNKPGFTQVLIEWLREVKSQGISPEEVQMHADQSQSERDQQLAKLYQRYQDFLHDTNTSDADGLLWLAAERLEGDADLLSSDEPFFILGFDHFNPLQVRFLEQIAKRRRAFFIYLLWDQERSRDSLALYRLGRTRSTLERSLSPQVVNWEGVGRPPSSIRHVSETLFELQPLPYQADQSLAAIAVPSREAEVRYAVREIKELLLSGVLPHQIGLLVTDKPVYLSIIQAVSREYGVPVQVEGQLHDQPAIAQLINLLSLYPDFPWRQTMDALRSPYFRQPWLDAQQIDRLDQLSRQRPVVAGIDQWSYALQPSEAGGESLDDDERRSDFLVDQLSAEDLSEIGKGLLAFFNHLTPPSTASMRAFGIWLQENILGPFPQEQANGEEEDLQNEGNVSLEMWNCCAENLQFRERDLQSVVSLTEVISQMVAASFINISDPDEDLTWESFRDELFTLLPSTALPLDPLQGGVTCESIHAARSSIFDYTIVLGMSEGEFPR